MDATLAIRQAVRPWVETADARILLGVSGGADSMALAIATLRECRNSGVEAVAIIINHQLQEGSSIVASQTQAELFRLGFLEVEVMTVDVELTDGMEASARRARYQAFDQAIAKYQPDYFFLAHTKNDQAESVLLGLARGSGTRSLSGIAMVNGRFIRPLLDIDRKATAVSRGLTASASSQSPTPSYSSTRRICADGRADKGDLASSTGLSPALALLSSRLRLAASHPMTPAPRPRAVSRSV
jgi:tRNA(Ile)-lysidine synthetase-like protein